MKIILDIDGTLTDFSKFINDNAISYFKDNYNMEIINEDELEVEDIFDMDNFFMKKYNCNVEQAKKYTKKALDKFWVNLPRFIKFSLLNKFKLGASEFIKECQKRGYTIEIHSSRAKTTDKNIIGEVCRKFTYLQCLFNGVNIKPDSFHFYKNDEEKIKGIQKSNPNIIFEDKSEIIRNLENSGYKIICLNENYNKDIKENKNIIKIKDFREASDALDKLLGKKKLEIINRIINSDDFYKKARIVIPIIMNKFKPIILNEDNLLKDINCGIVVAPNHRSTLDPLIITSIYDKNIHWAALKRFFDGKDSIFNNSKNKVLCKITSKSFKKFEYFPIERLRDNPKAKNFNSIKNMTLFLNQKQMVGIFPEGTTNRPEGEDFGTFDPAFIMLAKNTDSYIQPITVLWIKDLNLENKLIVNFKEPFKLDNLSKEEAFKRYLEIQKEGLLENTHYYNKLKNTKILKKNRK